MNIPTFGTKKGSKSETSHRKALERDIDLSLYYFPFIAFAARKSPRPRSISLYASKSLINGLDVANTKEKNETPLRRVYECRRN